MKDQSAFIFIGVVNNVLNNKKADVEEKPHPVVPLDPSVWEEPVRARGSSLVTDVSLS